MYRKERVYGYNSISSRNRPEVPRPEALARNLNLGLTTM